MADAYYKPSLVAPVPDSLSSVIGVVLSVLSTCTLMTSVLYYVLLSVPLPILLACVAFGLLSGIVYIRNLLHVDGNPPKLFYKDSAFAKYILRRCRRFTVAYTPPAWGCNAHAQTLIRYILPNPECGFKREYLMMKDKGIVALDWGEVDASKVNKSSPVIIILPDLTGDAASMSFACLRASNKGFRPVVFNKRGHGGTPLTTPKLQSFGDPNDLRQVVKYVRSLYPLSRVVALGSSAGSGLLMSYLGEYGSSSYLSACVCISPGYDVTDLFQQPVKWPYGFLLLTSLKRLLWRHAKALSNTVDVVSALHSRTLSEFDEHVYCKIYKISDLDTYWDRNNPMRDIDDVCCPVLCISSLDDPICVRKNIPVDLFTMYPNFILATTEYGGHCGFIEQRSMNCWAEKVAIEYLQASMEFLNTNDALR